MDKICTLLDKLSLDALTLMETHIQMKLNIENAMSGGEMHLAKSRYILGQNGVSALQLPGEGCPDFEATATVRLEEDEFKDISREVQIVKKEEQTDPVRWFGYLVPQDLYHAQSMFKQALHWVVEAANVQKKLSDTCLKYREVKKIKVRSCK